MVQIGRPQSYEEPVETGIPAVAPIVLSEQRMTPVINEDFTEDHYGRLKQAFLDRCDQTDGPWELTVKSLATICTKTGLPTGAHVDLPGIWLRMVRELCPADLIIPQNFNVVERMLEVDDNRNIIFAVGIGPFLGQSVRVLRLSNVASAVLLRMAFK